MYSENLILDISLSVLLGAVAVILQYFGVLTSLPLLYWVMVIGSITEFLLAAFFSIKNQDNGCCCIPVKKLIFTFLFAAPFSFFGILLHITAVVVVYIFLFLATLCSGFSFICAVRLVACCADRGCEIDIEEKKDT